MVSLIPEGSSGTPQTWSLGAWGDGYTAGFHERSSMILGMNGGPLRQKRMWEVYLWKQKRHWAIVLQAATLPFDARAVDDFMYCPTHCCNVEVMSSRFFLVYELLLPDGMPQLMVSIKTDFDPDRSCVQALGLVGDLDFTEVNSQALAVVESFRCYSLVGSNCQHFAKDFASKLQTPVPFTPEDEAVAEWALRNAEKIGLITGVVAVGCVGGIIAPDATLLTATAAAASQLAFGSQLPLAAIAVGAGTVGLAAGVALGSVGAGYCLLHAGLRTSDDGRQPLQEELCGLSLPSEELCEQSKECGSDQELPQQEHSMTENLQE